MGARQIDLLNVGLILLSAVLAYFFPLELFVLAYAILGPLHYFTEISWLDKKNYFINQPKKLWLIIGVIAATLIVFPKVFFFFNDSPDSTLAQGVTYFNGWTNAFIFLTLLLATALVLVKKRTMWLLIAGAGVIGAVLLKDSTLYSTIIGLLVPTVIHVYLFTLLFMLYGSMKSKSRVGYVNVLLAIAVPLVFVGLDLQGHSYLFSDEMKNLYLENNFHVTAASIGRFIGASDGTSFFFYESLELKIMMFISFIYLYHYLNWFSKTSIIGWHKNLNWKKTLLMIGTWVGLLGLFYADYRLGFVIALFFSFLHVILEFPLNIVSISGLIKGK